MKTLTKSHVLLASLVFCAVLVFFSLSIHCAVLQGEVSVMDSLNSSRIAINKTAMFTLGAWALGNIAANSTLLALQSNLPSTERGSAYYFQQMNIFWNVVNLGLAVSGLYGAYTESPAGISLFESIDKQSSLERILLLNAGLDCAYITAGAWMLERSTNKQDASSLWKGYGQSLLLQGAFLLVFDIVVYGIHHTTSEPLLRELLSHVNVSILSGGGLGLGVTVRW